MLKILTSGIKGGARFIKRLKFSGRNSIGEKMGKDLFFELACMPEGIENFEQWNQRWGIIYQTIENFRWLSLMDFVLDTI